jgi:hypothetical protein
MMSKQTTVAPMPIDPSQIPAEFRALLPTVMSRMAQGDADTVEIKKSLRYIAHKLESVEAILAELRERK